MHAKDLQIIHSIVLNGRLILSITGGSPLYVVRESPAENMFRPRAALMRLHSVRPM